MQNELSNQELSRDLAEMRELSMELMRDTARISRETNPCRPAFIAGVLMLIGAVASTAFIVVLVKILG